MLHVRKEIIDASYCYMDCSLLARAKRWRNFFLLFCKPMPWNMAQNSYVFSVAEECKSGTFDTFRTISAVVYTPTRTGLFE